MRSQEQWLRIAFAAGFLTDACALVPMLCPPVARLMWGFDHPTGSYSFAMGYGASLMLGWTLLLGWAWLRPLDRSFVALLTLIVIAGLAATEVRAVVLGDLRFALAAPTWVLQGILAALFAIGYHGWLSRPTSTRPTAAH